MSKLAPLLGTEITVKFYLERFRCLCNDSLFQVRKVCAVSIGDIAAVIGTNLTEKFLVSRDTIFACLTREITINNDGISCIVFSNRPLSLKNYVGTKYGVFGKPVQKFSHPSQVCVGWILVGMY